MPTEPAKLKVALYSRVSTTDQETGNQLLQLREFVARQGWQVAGEYVDNGQSGAKTGSSRPEFAHMMRDASQRRFDVLLFWSLDRLSREGVSQTLDYLNRLQSWGVGFRSFTEQYLDSLGMFKDAVLAILACIAKQERVRISERTKAGLERAKRNGAKLGRPPVTAELAGKIRELRASGKNIRAVSQALNVAVGTVCKVCRQTTPSG
ncbi:MAG: recombinase family protein [Verrucomicrobiae bacterium]|nr:recombinase family protein [Verrucomicrobiae bacterium]